MMVWIRDNKIGTFDKKTPPSNIYTSRRMGRRDGEPPLRIQTNLGACIALLKCASRSAKNSQTGSTREIIIMQFAPSTQVTIAKATCVFPACVNTCGSLSKGL